VVVLENARVKYTYKTSLAIGGSYVYITLYFLLFSIETKPSKLLKTRKKVG